MANVNSGKILGNMIDEGNRRGFPNMFGVFQKDGRKITAGLTLIAAAMLVLSSLTSFLPELPRQEQRFRDRGNRRDSH